MSVVPPQPSLAPGSTPERGNRRARRELVDALVRNDLDAAETALARIPEPLPADALEPAAMLHLARRRWDEAAALFDRFFDADAHVAALRTYARNMAAARRARPDLYDLLINTPDTGRYDLVTVAAGQRSIARLDPPHCLTPAGDPAANVERARAAVAQLATTFAPVILGGIGDGHVLATLARNPTPSQFNKQQIIYVLEPDPELVRACFLLHDYAGPDGPITHRRFHWCVGPAWDDDLRNLVADDPQLPISGQLLFHTQPDRDLADRFARVVTELDADDARIKVAVDAIYDSPEMRDIHRVFRGETGRKPRVMLLTSRFTTVLQHSTRDTAAAFEELGWETFLCIEQSDAHQLTLRAVRRAVRDFKPDLVFIIDHLRREYGDLFPPQLPFVCWVQDDLLNLTNAVAGRSITPRDFVLTCGAISYHEHFGYPLRQCLFLEKLTRLPPLPAAWTSDGDDLTFVSNASRSPESAADEFVASAHANARIAHLLRQACDAMLATYRDGGCLSTVTDVRRVVQTSAETLGMGLSPGEQQHVAHQLFNTMNNPLYRQQTLEWAAAVAKRLGLKLGLYGAGWKKHPALSPYARGPVAYGRDLEELTRRSRVNLQIVPFSCLHQRLLDGLAAGGFFLIRRHVTDDVFWGLGQLVRPWEPNHPRTTAELLDRTLADGRPDIRQLIQRCRDLDPPGVVHGDPVATLSRSAAERSDYRFRTLPDYEEVVFDTEAGLEALVRRFAGNGSARRHISDRQRAHVAAHFTYTGRLEQVLQRIAELLEEDATAGPRMEAA